MNSTLQIPIRHWLLDPPGRTFAALTITLVGFIIVAVARLFEVDLLAHYVALSLICLLLGFAIVIVIFIAAAANRIGEDLIYLAAETAQEPKLSSENFAIATKSLADLLNFYATGFRKRPFVSLILPLIRLDSQIDITIEELRAIRTVDATENIHALGEDLARYSASLRHLSGGAFYDLASRFTASDPKMLSDFTQSVDEATHALEELVRWPSLSNATVMYHRSRNAGAILHCYWPELLKLGRSRNDIEVMKFMITLERASALTAELARTIPKHSQEISKLVSGLERRRKALDALLKEDREELWQLLRFTQTGSSPDGPRS